VVTVTQLAGAGAPNVIPTVATAAGTVRTMRPQDMLALHAFAGRFVEQVAAAHGCTGVYRVRRGEPALVNDASLAHAARGWLETLGQPLGAFASCGSDDFATYGAQLPILMIFVGTTDRAGTADPGTAAPMLHDARFLPDDDRVADVARALLAGWVAGAQVLADSARLAS
jgi:amidohydrolase